MNLNLNLWPFRKDPHSQFESLVGPHIHRLYHLAYRFTGQRDDAEDLVQDLLLKLFPRLQEMQQANKLGPWLDQVLYHLFVDQFRRQQQSPLNYANDGFIYDFHASELSDPSDIANTALLRNHLNAALQKLKQEQRVLILLHDVEGYSLEEIHQLIKVPVGTIKSRLSRARATLRKFLNSWNQIQPTACKQVTRR